MSRRFPILLAALAVPALALTPALSASAATVVVYADELGTVNYDGGGQWGVAAPSDPPWDRAAGALFTGLPTDGAPWTLDIEGKVTGAVSTSPDHPLLTTVGYPTASPEIVISQKLRFMYYLGAGAYPELDVQDPTVADLLSVDFSITGIWTEDVPPAVPGRPTMDLKLQNPATGQRVSLHSAGTGASEFTSASTTLALSDPARNWRLNSAVGTHGQYTDISSATLIADLGTWDVVAFGPNVGRSADGAFTLQAITALGTDFLFAGVRPAAVPAATLPDTGQGVSLEVLGAGLALVAVGVVTGVLARRARRSDR